MAKKIKVGVIGCGGISRGCHLPAYMKMKDIVEVVAFCDIIPERARMSAETYGSGEVFTDYKDVIAIEGLDAIDICTPNYWHAIIAVDALNAGIHVFSEKPDAVDVEAVLGMQAAAEKNGKTLMVMRNNRYYEGSVFLKNFIREGGAGEIYAGRCGWQRTRGIPGRGGWFTTKELSGGGPLIDLGVHMIDLAIWLMGNPTPVAVSGSTYQKFADYKKPGVSVNSKFGDTKEDGTFDVEDLAMGFIKFDNGACLTIEFSWASNVARERRFVELMGTRAGMVWENGNKTEIYSEQQGVMVKNLPELNYVADGHEMNLRHFYDVIGNGAEPDFVPQQGVDMIKILRAIYESAETGREVRLDQ